MDIRKIKLFFSLVVLLLVFAGAAIAQVDTGSISGSVHDSSGAVVPGAKITAQNLATGVVRTVETGSSGQYTLVGLAPGNYKVTVVSSGFKTFSYTGEVTVGGSLTVNPQLEVGSTSVTVEVTAGFGGTEVNTQTQDLSQLVDSTQLAQLPSLNRNPYDFVVLSGNVSNGDSTTSDMNSSQNMASRGVGYSINGQRESGTEILLDGVENTAIFGVSVGQLVPADSIQEFSIITNNFGAEYGRASGGVVNVDTKAGTNEIHGSVFEYNRLSDYTSNTFANSIADVPKGAYVRNQFGYNIGGPILKNKLFATFSEEFVRVRSSANVSEDIFDPSFISLLPSNVQSYFSKYGTGALPGSTTYTADQLQAQGFFGTTSGVNNPIPLLG
ncbi:MAG: carboxypeptidase regulatory-like domain-containing protein, partial [Candidatus Acidiferrum sp.]